MKRKGLCDTCIHGKKCVLPNKFPVWQCEEFSDCVNTAPNLIGAVANPKRDEEETPAE